MNQKFSWIRQIMIAFVLIAAIEGFSSCEKYSYTPPALDPNAPLSFQTDIQPIFNTNCLSCHGANLSPDLRDGKSFLALTKGGYVILPGESSRLYVHMTSAGHTSRSTDTEKLKVLYWINQGALNN
jgi:hypothetical protein